MDSQKGPVVGPALADRLERGSGATLHEQLERRLRDQIRSGALAPGTRVPSSRALAAELSISRGVVLEAYSQLIAEGYLTASQGAPTRVAATPSIERPPVPASSLALQHAHDFDPTIPDVSAFARDRWLAAIRAALRDAPFAALGHGDPRGMSELRNELTRYLSRVRSASPEPEHTVICAGFTQGLAVLCRALRDRGVEQVAVEDPGWSQHRVIAERAGLEPVPVAVDEHGIDVGSLETSRCETVIVTPAHQFPTGAVLSSERRAALLDWAEERDALIIEDDYDSELRYDRVAVGALQGLAPERVCHIGSVSKRLVPGLRLGWMLSPSWLSGALTYEKGAADGGAPAVEQLALADFIARGELDRHLRRVRGRYRQRRETLISSIARSLPEARPVGIAAGVFVLVLLPAQVREDVLLSAAAARGVAVEGLAYHRVLAGPPGIVLGYANLPEPAIERGVELLAEAFAVSMT